MNDDIIFMKRNTNNPNKNNDKFYSKIAKYMQKHYGVSYDESEKVVIIKAMKKMEYM